MAWLTKGKDIDFMGLRKYFLSLSLLLIILSTVAIYLPPGPRFGTDFVGGTEVEVAFKTDISAAKVRATVQAIGLKSPDVVAVGKKKNHFLIRVKEVTALEDDQIKALQLVLCEEDDAAESKLDTSKCPGPLRTTSVVVSPGGDKVSVRYKEDPCEPGVGTCALRDEVKSHLTNANLVPVGVVLRTGGRNPIIRNRRDFKVDFYFKSKGDQIMDGLLERLGKDTVPVSASTGAPVPLRVEWIGPKAGRQLRDSAIKSILIAVIFIMVYIAFRFDLRFAPGAIVALVHDVFLAMGAMVLAQREVTLSTVAALLTIVGYSINDTVVVYDRIRENLGRYRKMTFPKIINRSITEMLGRTVRTSGLTAAAVAPFLFYGTGIIRDFAFTLLIGVVVGTYSSIYIAAPLTELIDRKFFGKVERKKKRRVKRRKKKDGPASKKGEAKKASITA